MLSSVEKENILKIKDFWSASQLFLVCFLPRKSLDLKFLQLIISLESYMFQNAE